MYVCISRKCADNLRTAHGRVQCCRCCCMAGRRSLAREITRDETKSVLCSVTVRPLRLAATLSANDLLPTCISPRSPASALSRALPSPRTSLVSAAGNCAPHQPPKKRTCWPSRSSSWSAQRPTLSPGLAPQPPLLASPACGPRRLAEMAAAAGRRRLLPGPAP